MSLRLNQLTRQVGSQLPTLLVLLALAGIGYYGYRTEWRAPRFAALWGGGAPAEKSEGANGQGGHSASEPKLTVTPDPAAPKPPNPANSCPIAGVLIQFPSAALVRNVGIQFAQVRETPLAAHVTAPAEIDYDQTRVAQLPPRVPGIVWRVEKDAGDPVKKGDLLALVDALRVGEAKAEFLQALVQFDLRTKTEENLRVAGTAVPGRQLQEAEASLREARVRRDNTQQALANLGLPIQVEELTKLSAEERTRRVRFLGLPESVSKDLDPEATANLLPVKAPFEGIVAERHAATGEVVESSKPLFVVADVRRMWVMIDVRMEDADRIERGQAVAFYPDGHPGEVAQGTIDAINTAINEKTRTLRVRVVVDNPREHWRARTFGAAQITVRDIPKALVVPNEAIQEEGSCHAVFVRLTDTTFQAREVRLGVRDDKVTEVLSGVKLGETVATTGSHVLKSEILKGKLGSDND